MGATGDISELAFVHLRDKGPPPIDDDPPFPCYTMSIGMALGRFSAEGHLQQVAAYQAACRIGAKKTIEEIDALVGWER
jgi:hypothetical protein